MGVFSFNTSDTRESIPVVGNWLKFPPFTVTMKDNAGNVWTEKAYGGYGVFGGKDFYDVLGEMNPEHPAINDPYDPLEDLFGNDPSRLAGLRLAFLDNQDGILYPTLSRDPDFAWCEAAKPSQCEFQGYFY